MKIQSKLTKAFQEVTNDEWQKMKENGIANNFEVVSKDSSKEIKAPVAANVASYEAILKTATALFKEGRKEEALSEYQKADAIKATPMVTAKIKELQEALKEAE